jgi:archaellum biogenesis protein FlaJ (TadC family)
MLTLRDLLRLAIARANGGEDALKQFCEWRANRHRALAKAYAGSAFAVLTAVFVPILTGDTATHVSTVAAVLTLVGVSLALYVATLKLNREDVVHRLYVKLVHAIRLVRS